MSANDNALCSSCGLCCSGWMFSAATPAAGEVARFRELTALVGDRVPQPCPFHDGACCRIYDARPSGCRNFRCDTLEAHAQGELLLTEALERVDAAKARLSAVVGAMRDKGWIANNEAPAVAWMRLVGVMQSGPSEMSTDDRRRLGALLIEAASAVRALKALAGPIEMG